MPSGSGLWNSRTKVLIRVLISTLLLFWLFRAIHPEKIISATAKADTAFLGLAVLFQIFSNLIAGYRWYLSMNSLELYGLPSFFIKGFFKGAFFNQVLPGSIGGDGVRMLELKTLGYGVSDAVEGVIVDRGVGLLSLLSLCLLGTFMGADLIPLNVLRGIRTICLSGIVGFGLLAIFFRFPVLNRIKLLSFPVRISEKIWHLCSAGRKTPLIFAFSLIVHGLAVLSIYFVSLSVGQNLGFLIFLVIFPSVILLTVIPISFAGWGIREGAMVGLFMSAGVDKAPVLFISLLYGVVVIIASIPGMLFWLQRRKDNTIKDKNGASIVSLEVSKTTNVRLKYE